MKALIDRRMAMEHRTKEHRTNEQQSPGLAGSSEIEERHTTTDAVVTPTRILFQGAKSTHYALFCPAAAH